MPDEDLLRRCVQRSGRSATRARLALLEILTRSHSHPTAAELYDQVRKRLPGITLATVYRNLAALQELGLVKEIPTGTSAAHYDAVVTDHSHVQCVRCGKVSDVHVQIPEGWQTEVEAQTNYTVVGQLVLFRGVCPDCQAADGTTNTKREEHGHVS